MLDIHQRDFSPEILRATGIPRRLFPTLVEAGDRIGSLRYDAAALFGDSAGLPVFSAGHDTQFALFGAGASRMNRCSPSGTLGNPGWRIFNEVNTAFA